MTDRLDRVRALSDQIPRFLRLTHAAKVHRPSDGHDRAPLVLLYPLVRLGPLRQGALAEVMHADPSTVSRHVTTLVEEGLVRRMADESDGRASTLHVTAGGREVLEQLRREREQHLGDVTGAWSEDELSSLTTLLERFLDDLADSLPAAADSDRRLPEVTR